MRLPAPLWRFDWQTSTRMKSVRRGRRTSRVEVTSVSAQRFGLLLAGRELFVPFADFPWFRDASIGQLLAVERTSSSHLYWPQLDVDLSVESIEHPERYPLASRTGAAGRARLGEAHAARERRPAYGAGRRRRQV